MRKVLAPEIVESGLTEILMVCTANTCRSPFAAVIMRNELARKIGTDVDGLFGRGYLVRSAGPWANVGQGISQHSKTVLEELGYPVPERGARELTGALTASADYIYAMTQWHLKQVLQITPGVEGKIRLLDIRGIDILDPVGEDINVYRIIGKIIQGCVRERVEQIWADGK